jgi:hypothetical protein
VQLLISGAERTMKFTSTEDIAGANVRALATDVADEVFNTEG